MLKLTSPDIEMTDLNVEISIACKRSQKRRTLRDASCEAALRDRSASVRTPRTKKTMSLLMLRPANRLRKERHQTESEHEPLAEVDGYIVARSARRDVHETLLATSTHPAAMRMGPPMGVTLRF